MSTAPRLLPALAVAALGAAAAGCASPAPAATGVPPVEDVTLRFESEGALDDWVVTGGEWRVDRGALRGRSLDPSGAADEYAVYATPFAEIERVVLVGGLETDAPQNFRFAVGAVGVILNWEGANDNVIHHGYRPASHRSPHALEPGRESEVVLERTDRRIRLVVDDVLLWEDEGTLSGTLTLSAAFRTRMWVREIRIRGRPLSGLRVWRPSAPAP